MFFPTGMTILFLCSFYLAKHVFYPIMSVLSYQLCWFIIFKQDTSILLCIIFSLCHFACVLGFSISLPSVKLGFCAYYFPCYLRFQISTFSLRIWVSKDCVSLQIAYFSLSIFFKVLHFFRCPLSTPTILSKSIL